METIIKHQHYIIRAEINNTEKLQDLQLIERWMLELIESIDMKILIYPIAKYCDKQYNKGVTAIAAIETSHMAIHIWDEVDPAILQFDLYSCKSFDEQIVLNMIDETFGLKNYKSVSLDRDPILNLK